MSKNQDPFIKPENKLLGSLPIKTYKRILPTLEIVELNQGDILSEPGEIIDDVYFPNDGIISLVSVTENGSTIEVGMIGMEGMLGVPVLLGARTMPYQPVVQISGTAFKMKVAVLKSELDRCSSLQKIFLRYTHALLIQTSQAAVCNSLHKIEKRLCRWLLIAQDCVQSDNLRLTQETMSHLIGTRRAGVNSVINSLQKEGLIDHSRGQITIIDREGLEDASCECYRVIKEEFDKALAMA